MHIKNMPLRPSGCRGFWCDSVSSMCEIRPHGIICLARFRRAMIGSATRRRESIKDNEINRKDEPIETIDDEEQWLFDDQDDDADEEPGDKAPRKWIKRTVAALLAIALLGNLLAFWPEIYSLQAIQFLKKNRELSQNGEIQQYKQAIVVVNAKDRKGTGFNIAANGLIITNQHVIEDEKTVIVSFLQGDMYTADVIVSDPSIDIAILKIRNSDTNLPMLEIETEARWQAGSPIYVIGNPLFFNQIANEGTVLGLTPLEDWSLPVLMIQAPIYKGNSGSPVINEQGKVIAVVFATTTINHNNQSQKVGLAIPIDYLQKYIQTL
jgi:serine protease Do